MIDPHVHLRDWKQKEKETVRHGLLTAFSAGLDAVFDMPNTAPSLIRETEIKERLKLAESLKSPVFYGIYAGLTFDINQIEEMVKVYNKYFPSVVGFKLFAGKSTGDLAVIQEEMQKTVLKTLSRLNYRGVLAVHCEKESCMHPELYNPEDPFTHTLARPGEAEIEGIKDILRFASDAGFKGTVHICHISLKASVDLLKQTASAFRITCGVTPHHLLLDEEMMKNENGHILRMNPPLRAKEDAEKLLIELKKGNINWIETDHAPHKLSEKHVSSGIPGFPVFQFLLKWLAKKGFSEELINKITHENITDAFNIDIKNREKRNSNMLFDEYEFNPYIFSKDIASVSGD